VIVDSARLAVASSKGTDPLVLATGTAHSVSVSRCWVLRTCRPCSTLTWVSVDIPCFARY
jgi:hypothetical protein